MKTDTADRILAYITEKKRATPHELAQFFHISGAAVHRQLKKLVELSQLVKLGKPPLVFYAVSDIQKQNIEHALISQRFHLTPEEVEIMNNRYLYITPLGEMHFGLNGFMQWCEKTHQEVDKTTREYIATLAKYDTFRKNGVLNGMQKLKDTFDHVYLDEIFYLDFYSIERFGKTKLGQMLLYAKQNQNKELIRKLVNEIRPKIIELVTQYEIDAIGFAPPTVKRSVQFMTECATILHLTLPQIELVKINGEIAIPQKTLSRLEDRIENANRSIFVTDKRVFKHILLIDDAVGSGATLNETAKKIREQGVCTGKIIGLAITGSAKGFDVLSEV